MQVHRNIFFLQLTIQEKNIFTPFSTGCSGHHTVFMKLSFLLHSFLLKTSDFLPPEDVGSCENKQFWSHTSFKMTLPSHAAYITYANKNTSLNNSFLWVDFTPSINSLTSALYTLCRQTVYRHQNVNYVYSCRTNRDTSPVAHSLWWWNWSDFSWWICFHFLSDVLWPVPTTSS
jgi:hypothetical protein